MTYTLTVVFPVALSQTHAIGQRPDGRKILVFAFVVRIQLMLMNGYLFLNWHNLLHFTSDAARNSFIMSQ